MRAGLRLLVTCAAAALAAGTAHGQAFNATPTVVSGSVTIDRTTPGVDRITVNSQSAIVNWASTLSPPQPDPAVFLPAGATAQYLSDVPGLNYAILNRIAPVGNSRMLFDGKVVGRMLDANGALVPGGTIAFFSPTGIILGANASFDVGNLLLTTLNPATNAAGEFFVGGRFDLAGGGQFPDSAVETRAGSTILASAEGSWIAFAGPRILHGGSVNVNGAAAYVGAEAVQLTIDQGLFDIQVLVGSSAANPIVHTGQTVGPASLGAADRHGIYMAASGQDAITLLLSGNVGFAPATVAGVENGAIILSAGHDVDSGQIDPAPNDSPPSSIQITGGRWTSDVTGRASADIVAGNTGAGELRFEQDVRFSARNQVILSADRGWLTHVGGDAILSAANTAPLLIDDVATVTGGVARIFAGSGARVEILGNAVVDSSATGGISTANAVGDGSGGESTVTADKGNVAISGTLDLVAIGTGADGAAAGLPTGGAGRGGNAVLSALNGGDVRVGGAVRVDSSGLGGRGAGADGGTGWAGTGGTARIESRSGSRLAITGSSQVTSLGVGGRLGVGPTTTGGTGQGGSADLLAEGGAIDLTGPVQLQADGTGGGGQAGGTGLGGGAHVDATDGRITFAAAVQASANGTGAAGGDGTAGRGGDGAGGEVRVAAHSGGAGSAVTAPGATLRADGSGGASGTAGGRGGDARGGQAAAFAEALNGRLQVGELGATANGTGGPGTPAGNGAAGNVMAGTLGGPAGGAPLPVTAGRADFANVRLSAVAIGTIATGGSATLASNGAPVVVTGTADLQAGTVALSAARPPAGASGSLSVGTATGRASGSWRVSATGGSNVRIDDATLTATPTAAGPASTIEADNGSLVRTVNSGSFATQAAIAVNVQGSGQLAGGTIALDGGTGITIVHAAPPAGARTIDAARFTATTGGGYSAAGTAIFGQNGVTIQAGGDALLGDTRTVANLAVTAGGTARFRALATGRQVDVAARDIDIPDGARIGDAATIRTTLTVLPTGQPTTLGGAAQGPGYTLSQAEAARIRADLVRVAAPGDVAVGDLALAGGGGPNGIDAFEVATPGTVRVAGALAMTNANAAGRIGIAAGRLEVTTPGGSVRIRDNGGAPSGTLDVAATDIWVAADALIAQLRADPNFAGRDAALQANDGPDTPLGFVEAGRIRLAPAATLYVQNSGTAASYGGLTVGAGGLEIAPAGAQPTSVTAFGRRLTPNGIPVTNFAFFGEVRFNRAVPPRYTDESEFNRCNINSGICRGELVQIPGLDRPGAFGPFPIPPQGSADDPLDDSAFLAEPLIEEPVTSGSDSTLWAGPDDDDDDDDEDDEE